MTQLNWKKPLFWIIVACLVIALVSSIVVIANHSKKKDSGISYVFTTDSYAYYQTNKLDFRFIVATVSVETDPSVSVLPLNSLYTDGINLGSISTYLAEVNTAGGDLSQFQFASDAIGLTQGKATFTLFIPVLSSQLTQVTLFYGTSKQSAGVFSLENVANAGDLSAVKLNETPSVDPVDPSVSVQGDTLTLISNKDDFRFYDSAGNLSSVSPISSSATVYAYAFTVSNPSGKEVTIQSAVLTVGSADSVSALDKTYYLEGYSNCISTVLSDKLSGVLFFETFRSTVYSNASSLSLTITLSNGDVLTTKVKL